MDRDLERIGQRMSASARRQLADALDEACAALTEERMLRVALRCVAGRAQDGIVHLEVNLTKRRLHRPHRPCTGR